MIQYEAQPVATFSTKYFTRGDMSIIAALNENNRLLATIANLLEEKK